jgi:hypothetical protein
MKVQIRKTTYDSEIGHMRPGMIVEVNKQTGDRWVKYRIADEVEETIIKSKAVVPVESITEAGETIAAIDVPKVDLEMLTKSEIRTLAEKRGITFPVKASKADMLQKLDGVDLK